MTVERMAVEPNPKKTHPKNPSVKSMAKKHLNIIMLL
jgi:hypothetical protein